MQVNDMKITQAEHSNAAVVRNKPAILMKSHSSKEETNKNTIFFSQKKQYADRMQLK
jgi:hypothetical protein